MYHCPICGEFVSTPGLCPGCLDNEPDPREDTDLDMVMETEMSGPDVEGYAD